MKPRTSLRAALEDPALLGNILAGDSWAAWRIILIAAMGEELTEEERAIFTKLTGREREPGQRIEEFAAVVGRRGGKSRSMATFAAYIGGLCKHNLVPGEQGIVLLCAGSKTSQGNTGLLCGSFRAITNPAPAGHQPDAGCA
jgi:hypothetical protein